ncbi:DUF1796 family putative cysteine peptidase [Paenibacillus filicis]|uniref:DUF1796 family putative cysteine peptidase n=1 Tax=Paenibacillus filicis TaxID=669464 RepID=A0ABU9DM02_9BACL
MNLQELQGTYDGIYSLGNLCLTSIQLEKNNLRPYSGVFDWVASLELSKVNRLLANRFADFMRPRHLRVVGYADECICVSDDYNHIVSNHDFHIGPNSLTYLGGYPAVMEKYNRRIGRFLDHMQSCMRILFVRTEATLEDAEELESVLSELVKHDFRVLVVNHADVRELVEQHWPLARVCAVQLPKGEEGDKWSQNDFWWTALLQGIVYEETSVDHYVVAE